MNYVTLDDATAKPALRNGVLAVVAVTLLLIAAMVAESIIRSRRIPVTHLTVGTLVCLLISLEQTIIANVVVGIDNLA